MTSADEDEGRRAQDKVLAGEYVLGVLSLQGRRAVEDRIRRDNAFAMLVQGWEADLSSLNDEYAETAAPRSVFERVEARLFENGRSAPAKSGLWQSVVFWRSMTLASLIIGAGFAVFASGIVRPPVAPAQFVADLSAPDNKLALQASFDAGSGLLKVIPVAAQDTQSVSLQLWLVPNGSPPMSLGIFEPGRGGEIVIPAGMRDRVTADTTLAISLEPSGGSPTGQPTGPVVAAGTVRPR